MFLTLTYTIGLYFPRGRYLQVFHHHGYDATYTCTPRVRVAGDPLCIWSAGKGRLSTMHLKRRERRTVHYAFKAPTDQVKTK